MTAPYQYIRAQARRCDQLGPLLREAMRCADHCKHVERPQRPIILYGSPEDAWEAMKDYQDTSQGFTTTDGRLIYRQCRKDARGVMDCVISFPLLCAEIQGHTGEVPPILKPMIKDSMNFLLEEFGAAVKLALLHLDERYVHLHAFSVGSCQYLHPGMRMEIADGRRIPDGAERMRRHKQGLREFQDRFHLRVGRKYGWLRSGGKRQAPRIPDRKLYHALVAARKAAAEAQRDDLLEQIDKVLGTTAQGPSEVTGERQKTGSQL